jgi:hypothetical protein
MGSAILIPGNTISDIAYAASWDGVTTNAPSKNAIYDEMELRVPKSLFDAQTIIQATSLHLLLLGRR